MVHFETKILPTAVLGAENPLPDIGSVGYIHATYRLTDNISPEEGRNIGKGMISTLIPYRLQDQYGREKIPAVHTVAVVENDLLRAEFLPAWGGRLWSLYDKREGRELLYVNPVLQPCNLALRNAWFSGGVEFNVGIRGHNPLTCSPMHACIDETKDGQVLRLYEYERIRSLFYSVSAWMKEDEAVLYLRCRIENRSENPVYTYWWSNIALPETAHTRVIVPATQAFVSHYDVDHYRMDKAPIPVMEGRDVSYPARIPAARDFFFRIPDDSPKWIAALDGEGRGTVQCSDGRLFGRKLFVWGMGRGGRHWNEWLSETGSSYIEVQAGLAHTQMEHLPMPPHTVWEWNEAYAGISCDPDLIHGDYEGAVRAVSDALHEKVGSPDRIPFPRDESVLARQILHQGSGWGGLACEIADITPSLPFPDPASDPATAPWHGLWKDHTFPCPSPLSEPCAEAVSPELLSLLETLDAPTWHSLYHIGVIRYALAEREKASFEGAKAAWEQSVALCENPWALRNLAMLEIRKGGDAEKGRALLRRAFALKRDSIHLAKELAHQLTSSGMDGEWIDIYGSLSPELRQNERLRFYLALAHLHTGDLDAAAAIITPDFLLPDNQEGEISVSGIWFEIYRRIYARRAGIAYDPGNADLIAEADAAYPLPYSLDFRMYES